MNLNLQNDLCVFDIESTGLDVSKDRIVELSMLKINTNGEEKKLTLRVNPEIEISKESTEIHGISNEDVKDEPTFKALADQISTFIGDADLAGFNSNKFDIPMLAEEFLRVNHPFDLSKRKFVDVQNIFHKMEQRTLVAAYKFYCNKDLVDAHSAEADVIATYEVLKAQVERYEDLENNVNFLADFSTQNKFKIIDFAGRLAENDEGKAIYNFGKHKGKTIEEVDQKEPGYYGWMMNGNFPRYTKAVLKNEMEKIKAKRQADKKIKKEREAQRLENKLEALKNKFGN
ncbi:DNA polymerase III subunit epsilon [Brumimicrobium salinarum]|uniref:DNA polymerase III subunit epsilon n=1 Tax=Brumimicrobium salinarum TaxID=2058658 RepID=A0A2I0R1D0_9FLAO|nr:3'-5' exonuclease [Brumimicrobium salinarum]PKR80383.1 DNA polymerase III subunit epsilon [Brumimicrobium salinarum]